VIAALAAAFVAYAELTGSVDPGSGNFLLEAIHDAQMQGAEALVVRIDTPGGLLSTTRDVVQAELSAKVPIVFWVGPPGARAGSAGVFLTLAAHIARRPSSRASPSGARATWNGRRRQCATARASPPRRRWS
jgi:membrane-bound serine protease (ClpP class)